ncbi:unnamed protein product [Pocillopora meandrina]|uniref:Major facilitator superfamily (MFS) profile domain-containing protein n=1 Tax=Pocillopora meandrina TaxID=46732 RepID=A0AAU9X7X0_9CNID|nr:unnamed protein product [Pocillopora meandrina]
MADSSVTEEKSRSFEFDDIFEHVSSFGKYQKILYFCTLLLVFPVTNQFSLLVFGFGIPKFQCVTPNVTCEARKCCDGCHAYEFIGPLQSTVSEWNLICDRAFLGATIQSCFFAGMLVGSLVTGMISDAWGRKKCIFICNAIMLITGFPSAFVHSIPLFAVLRFMVGFGLTGVMLSLYIYGMELVGPNCRTATGNITYFYYNGFQMLFVLIAYLERHWRNLSLIATVPAALLFPFWKLIPESPRWLVAHDQLDEAKSIIEAFGSKDEKTLDSEVIRSLLEGVRREQIEREKTAKKYNPIHMFLTPKLRKWTAIICYQWFVVAMVNVGMFIFISQLVGDLYVSYVVIEILTVVRIPVTWILYLKFGRRICHGIIMILVGAIFLLVLLVHKESDVATTVLSLFGYLLIDCTRTSIYLMTSELFPTVLRNTGQGIGSTGARIGGILAPYVVLMSQFPGLSVVFPVVIFGVVATLAGILMYWIPETLYSPMHQTIEEAEAAEDDYGIPYCGKRIELRRRKKANDVEVVWL